MLKASKVLFICFWQVQKYMQINICVFSLPRRKWYDDKHEKKEKENTRNYDLLRGLRSCRDPCRLISIWTERKHAVSKTAIWYSVAIRLVPIYIQYILANCWETCDISDIEHLLQGLMLHMPLTPRLHPSSRTHFINVE